MPDKNPLTPDELAAIRERAERATPPPWFPVQIVHDFVICTGDNYDAPIVTAHERDRNTDEPCGVRTLQEACANAKFLANARADIPRLLDTIDAAGERADRLLHSLTSRNVELTAAEQERDELATWQMTAESHAAIADTGLVRNSSEGWIAAIRRTVREQDALQARCERLEAELVDERERSITLRGMAEGSGCLPLLEDILNDLGAATAMRPARDEWVHRLCRADAAREKLARLIQQAKG